MASDHNSCTNNVLDYYKKFALNSNLSKYFSGSSVQYLPVVGVPIRENDPNSLTATTTLKTVITTSSINELSVDCKSENILGCEKMHQEEKHYKGWANTSSRSHNSRLESPSDTKKLEWDSGADIGYIFQNSVEKRGLKKCLSLPVLNNFMADAKLNLNVPTSNTTIESDNFKLFILNSSPNINQEVSENRNISSDETIDDQIKEVSCSDLLSSSGTNSKTKRSRESSNNSESEESKLLDFRMTLSYLKEKIGLPGAHSTPDIPCFKSPDFLELRETETSFSGKSLNENDIISSQNVKSFGNTHIDNIPLVSQVPMEDAEMHAPNQPFFSKNGSMFSNDVKNETVFKKPMNRHNEKVIELSISTPISIDWTCSEVNGKDKLFVDGFEPKAVQTEDIFRLGLKSNTNQSKAVNQYESTLSFKDGMANIDEDCASDCDSFEYIRNNINYIKSLKEKKTLNPSKNKDNIFNKNKSKLQVVSDANLNGNNFLHNTSGLSKSVAEDIEKHVESLQKLLKSRNLHLNKIKYGITKLTKEFSDPECQCSNTCSEIFVSGKNKDKGGRPYFTEPSKEPTKSSSSSMENHTTLNSEDDYIFVKEQKAHLQDMFQRLRSPDYLLQFAENERAYQINWIKNEISHLTKLKTILEFQNSKYSDKRKINQISAQQNPLKSSVYKIMQEDDIGKKSEREYVIKTLSVLPDKKINYRLKGQKYSVTDCKIPQISTKSDTDVVENCVIADIKIQSEENQTNIEVNKLCDTCKQISCDCKLHIPGNICLPANNTNRQFDLSKQHTCKNIPKRCTYCQELKCVCQKSGEIRPTSTIDGNDSNISSSRSQQFIEKSHLQQFGIKRVNISSTDSPEELEHDQPEDFNSLQKIFQRCCCNVNTKKCNCIFVKKLFRRFLPNKNSQFIGQHFASSCDCEIKPKLISENRESQTTTLSDDIKNIDQFSKQRFQTTETTYVVGSSPESFEPSKDLMHFVDPEVTQTEEIIEVPSIKQLTNKSKCSYGHENEETKIINESKHLFVTTEKVILQDIENDIAMINKMGKSREPTLPHIKKENKFANIDSLTIIKDNSLNLESKMNTKYKNIGIQTECSSSLQSSRDFVRLVIPKATQTIEVVKDALIEQYVNESVLNSDHKNSETTNNEKHLFASKNESSQENIIENIYQIYEPICKIKNHDIPMESALSKMKKQNELAYSQNITETKDCSMNLTSEINNKYKDIGVQVVLSHDNLSSNDLIHSAMLKKTRTTEVTKAPSNNQFTSETKIVNDHRKIITNKTDEKYLCASKNTVPENVGLLDKIQKTYVTSRESAVHDIKPHDKFTNSNNITKSKDNSRNLAPVINTKYKDIGVQANVNLKNQSSQTWVKELYKKIYYQKKTVSDDILNNVDKKLSAEYKASSNNKGSKKDHKSITLEILGSKCLKGKDTHSTPHCTTISNDATSDGTFANYSQSGGTSANISTSVFDSRSIPSSRLTCINCNNKAFAAEVSYVQNGNTSYAICSRCYYNKPKCSNNDSQPKCRCHKILKSEQTSTCRQVCKCCKLKLMEISHIPKGVAYILTLEEQMPIKKKKHLTNVYLKEFNPEKSNDWKTEKNKENKNKTDMYLDQTKNDTHKRKDNKDFNTTQPELSKDSVTQCTLRDYLILNRPEFISSAEHRRQNMLKSRILREHQKDILKLYFLENSLNNMANKGQYKLFTEREIKEINKRNFQKLPEVQRKLNNIKEKRLKDADKLICDIFVKATDIRSFGDQVDITNI